MFSENSILVTGATGFIGKTLIKSLIEKQFSGFALIHKTESQKNMGNRFEEISGDLSLGFLSNFLQKYKPKTIFHLAGITNPNSPDLTLVNVDYVKNLIEAVKLHSPESTVIFMSTAAVYGEGLNRPPFIESTELIPINAYGRSKQQAENLLLDFLKMGGKVYIARAFNVIGKDQSENFFLPSLCKKLIAQEKNHIEEALLVRDSSSIRDFLDIRDLTAGLIKMLIKNPPYGIYNFSSGVGVSIQKVAEAAAEQIQNKKIKLKFINSDENNFIIKKSVGDHSKAKSALDWKLHYSLQDSIKEVMHHFR